jgi:hypothetical protein|tara:strand:+ start:930 stop:1124 length:195 start_codon:yes stop_codon:yes gene_type:complete
MVLVNSVETSFLEALAFFTIVLDLPDTEEAAEVAFVVALVFAIWRMRLVSFDLINCKKGDIIRF